MNFIVQNLVNDKPARITPIHISVNIENKFKYEEIFNFNFDTIE